MQTMDSMLPPRYCKNINHVNVSPANLHKQMLNSKINLPYQPVNPWLVMSPEKTNELQIGATGFLGNVTYIFLSLVIEVMTLNNAYVCTYRFPDFTSTGIYSTLSLSQTDS
jgi:hypothetical protein